MMKKIIFNVIILTALFLGANAQDSVLKSKRGIPILPDSSDWAIGIDATPFTNFFNTSSDVSFDFVNDHYTLMGKKFISPNLAHRAKLRLAFTSFKDDEYVVQDGQSVPDPFIYVTDSRLTNFTNITIGYGMERRTGYGRLQAAYGAEILISYEKFNESYTYGNSFSMENQNPTSYDFGTNIPIPPSEYSSGSRITYYEQGFAMTGALRIFLGVEYFFAPKISVGGEFGWGIAYTKVGDGKNEIQSWDPAANAVKVDIDSSGGYSKFELDNDNFGGAVFFLFHFN